MADKLLKSIKFPTLPDRYVIGDTTLTEEGAAADAKATGDEFTNVKSDIASYIEGVNITISGTPSALNKFRVLLLDGVTYSYTNNTGASVGVDLFKADGTSTQIYANLLNGETITFTVSGNDYVAVGGWFNSGSTGTVTIKSYYSVSDEFEKVEADITDNRNALYDYIETDVAAIATGHKLEDQWGYSVADANYKLLKYNVAEGALIKIVSDDKWQFQTSATVPSYGTSNRIGLTYGAGEYVVRVPATATHLIVSTTTTDSGADVYLCDSKIEQVEAITKIGSLDKLPSATRHENQFYNVNDTVYSGDAWDYYELSVTAGQVFTIDAICGGTVRGWTFLDSNGTALQRSDYSGDVTQKEFTNVATPIGASKLIVNHKDGVSGGYVKLIQTNATLVNDNRIIYNNKFLSEYLDAILDSKGILYGKTLCCCGDSITYGADMDAEGIVAVPEIDSYQWSAYTKQWSKWTANEPAAYGYQIAARNNMKFYNGGVSGATVQASGGDITVPGFSDASGEYTLLPDNIDYLTLFYGWNDTAFGSLGTIDDNTNATYYGAYNVVLPYLINKYPYTKIALIVPFGCDAGHREAIRLLANKWGVACFDMMQGGTPLYYNKEDSVGVEASIVTSNRAKFQANGAHPNFKGHYQIGTMLEQFLRGI